MQEREDYILYLANSIGEISDKKRESWGHSMYNHCVEKLRELHGESEESAVITRQTDLPW